MTIFASKTPRAPLLILFLLMSSGALSQTPQFVHIGYEDGLQGYTIWDTVQDNDGRIWIASSFGLASYNNYEVTPVEPNKEPWTRDTIRTLFVDNANTLWIGTYELGLVRKTPDQVFTHFRHDPNDINSINSNRILSITQDNEGKIWVGTAKGLNLFNPLTRSFSQITISSSSNQQAKLPNQVIRKLIPSSNGDIWIGTQGGLATLNPNTQTALTVPLLDPEPIVIDLFETENGILWLGTSTGAYRYDSRSQVIDQPFDELKDTIVRSISKNRKGLWFSVFRSGLFQLDSTGRLIQHEARGDKHSLAGNVVMSVMTDRVENTMFFGTFNNGISVLKLDSLSLGRHDNNSKDFRCMKSNVVYSVLPEKNNILWLGTDNGLAKINRKEGNCEWHPSLTSDASQLPRNIKGILRVANGDLYVSGEGSIARINKDNNKLSRITTPQELRKVEFTFEISDNVIGVGTPHGLFQYDIDSSGWQTIGHTDALDDTTHYHEVSIDQSGTAWFATSRGIYFLNRDNLLEPLRNNGKIALNDNVTNIFTHHDDTLWISIQDDRLLVLDRLGQIVHRFSDTEGFPGRTVSIVSDRKQDIWVSTLSGLVRIGKNYNVEKHFHAHDGLQGNTFTKNSAVLAENGELFFGGRQGFNAFFPHEIQPNPVPPSPHFDELFVHNQLVTPGMEVEGFKLDNTIDDTRLIKFSHKQQMFTIRFAAFDITDADGITYAYKLEGFDEEWNYIEHPERSATYTNMPPGNYRFLLKSANKDGLWSNDVKSLAIEILSAPWTTWQAKLFYILTLALLALTVLRRRHITQQRYAENLEREVQMRTREVEQQRETIKEILSRKNALFENISHEFKTPLTLLIGPLEQLRLQLEDSSQSKRVDLALRNAKRLLSMIDQLLRLAEVTHVDSLDKEQRKLAPALHMLVASFSPAAKLKEIHIETGELPDVSSNLTADAIEIIFGNLLSNAIKYSARGNAIKLEGEFSDGTVTIHVSDNGHGIEEDKTSLIFERFSRLPEHLDQPGTGLGLAVAKEVAEANDGTVILKSIKNVGSTFSVTLPATTLDKSDDQKQITRQKISHDMAAMAVSSVNEEQNPEISNSSQIEVIGDSSKPLILAIDDNADILSYIRSNLEKDFRFIEAADGKTGISRAQSMVPDLIICDVMMPGMDGFEVSKALREHQVTCHIPIILLTARADQRSKLLGWEASVDDYIQKPFNEVALLSRIHNLLRIRSVLRQNRGKLVAAGQLDLNDQQDGISKRDREFLKKLQSHIEQNFNDTSLDRVNLAKVVNVSERQLQRKLKALVDRNPVDLIREYRLIKAAELIAKGEQITLVAHMCGFNSGSYFTRCFKTHFGKTPKQYQMTLRN